MCNTKTIYNSETGTEGKEKNKGNQVKNDKAVWYKLSNISIYLSAEYSKWLPFSMATVCEINWILILKL